MLILGIESSCDETAVAVVGDDRVVLSNVIASQHDLHAEFAGVVPEIASRAHVERFLPVLRKALKEPGIAVADIDAIAVGHRPGLIGSLLTGVSAAKALAWSLDRPLIGVDHIHAHLYAGVLDRDDITFPALGLVVSGGHTFLYHLDSWMEFHRLGSTIDDAIGEAYDKAAVILGLDYPGGPNLDRLANQITPDIEPHKFPVSRLGSDSLDFSFSGLKTSMLYAVRGKPRGRGGSGGDREGSGGRGGGALFTRDHTALSLREKISFAAGFQQAAVKAVTLKIERALQQSQNPCHTLLVGGGVSANSHLRNELIRLGEKTGLDVRLPAMAYCMDNAAMIAALAFELYRHGELADLSLAAVPTAKR